MQNLAGSTASTLGTAAVVGAGVTIGAVAISVPLIKRATRKIDYWYHSYNATQMEEIGAIQKVYTKFCWENEKKCAFLSTLIFNLNKEATAAGNNAIDELPIFFQMQKEKDKKKLPRLYEEEWVPNPEIADWLTFVGKNCPLKHFIEEMLSYICEYQYQRNQRLFGKGYSYDPTNLFFEELKFWLLKLSDVQKFDEDVLTILENRIKYLNEFYIKNYFKPGKDLPGRTQIIKYLKDVLEKGITPEVRLIMSRASARDHFESLQKRVNNIIKNGIKFLFYVYRNTPDTPTSFIIDQIRTPTLPSYEESVKKTRSGQLLQHLLRTPIIASIFPPVLPTELTFNNIIKSEETIFNNDFLNSEGNPVYPLTTTTITLYNWYSLEEKTKNEIKEIGILENFCEKAVMEKFLKFHGQLQKLCLFSLICDQLFELSGDGGNLLVYGFALSIVKEALKSYEQLIEELKSDLEILYTYADNFKQNLLAKKKSNENEIQTWQKSFEFCSRAREEFNASINQNQATLAAIRAKIEEVNNKNYILSVQQRLHYLGLLIKTFSSSSLGFADEREKEINYNSGNFQKRKSKSSIEGARKREKNNAAFFPMIEPTKDQPPDEELALRFNEAVELYAEDNFEDALKIFLEIRNEYPKGGETQLFIARILGKNGFYMEAIEVLEPLIVRIKENEIDEQNISIEQILHLHARLCIETKDLDLARESAEILLRLNREDKKAMELIEKILEEKNQAFERLTK